MSYIENFNYYFEKAEKINGNSCKSIFASGPHLMNDLFKFWLAKKKILNYL